MQMSEAHHFLEKQTIQLVVSLLKCTLIKCTTLESRPVQSNTSWAHTQPQRGSFVKMEFFLERELEAQ